MNLPEPSAPAQQLPNDQRDPPLAQNLCGLCDRTELTVPLHPQTILLLALVGHYRS